MCHAWSRGRFTTPNRTGARVFESRLIGLVRARMSFGQRIICLGPPDPIVEFEEMQQLKGFTLENGL